MKFSELPLETQEMLKQKLSNLHKHNRNDAYNILIYSEDGTRYFKAHRRSYASHWAAFGGGSDWVITYGEMGFKSYRDPLGGVYYDICFGRKFGKIGDLCIPSRVDKKSEVIDIIKKIGKFNIQ